MEHGLLGFCARRLLMLKVSKNPLLPFWRDEKSFLFLKKRIPEPLVWVWGLSSEPWAVVSTSLSQNKVHRFIRRKSSGLCSFSSHFCLSVICCVPHRKPSHLTLSPMQCQRHSYGLLHVKCTYSNPQDEQLGSFSPLAEDLPYLWWTCTSTYRPDTEDSVLLQTSKHTICIPQDVHQCFW